MAAGPSAGVRAFHYPLASATAYFFREAEITANIALSRRKRERERERERGRETEYYPVEMLTSSETRPALVPRLPPCGGKFRKVHAGGKLYAIHCTPWARYRLELVENLRATDFFNAPCVHQNGTHPRETRETDVRSFGSAPCTIIPWDIPLHFHPSPWRGVLSSCIYSDFTRSDRVKAWHL